MVRVRIQRRHSTIGVSAQESQHAVDGDGEVLQAQAVHPFRFDVGEFAG